MDVINIFSGVPYLADTTKMFSSLAQVLASFDNGDGLFFSGHDFDKFLSMLNSYPEFEKCHLDIIHNPVFEISYINSDRLRVEKKEVAVSTFHMEYDENFLGECFKFSGTFYLYSMQFYTENSKYILRIRGHEEV
jgi:hypothetical protein